MTFVGDNQIFECVNGSFGSIPSILNGLGLVRLTIISRHRASTSAHRIIANSSRQRRNGMCCYR